MPSAPRTFYLVRQANAAVRARLERCLRDTNITISQYTVMSQLASRNALSSAKLARINHVSPQTMNELVVNLAGRGLVERQEDADNRRILLVSLTEEGRATLKECDRLVDKLEENFFAGFSAADMEKFRKALQATAAGEKAPNSD